MGKKNTRYLEKRILENTDRLIECAIAASLMGEDAKEKEFRRGVAIISEISSNLKELIDVKEEYLPEILSQIISQKLPDTKIQKSLGTFTDEMERMIRLGVTAVLQQSDEFFELSEELGPSASGQRVEQALKQHTDTNTEVPAKTGDTEVQGRAGKAEVPGQASDTGIPGQASDTEVPAQASDTGFPGQASDTGFPGQASDAGVPGQASDTGVPGQASDAGIPGQASDTGIRAKRSDTGIPVQIHEFTEYTEQARLKRVEPWLDKGASVPAQTEPEDRLTPQTAGTETGDQAFLPVLTVENNREPGAQELFREGTGVEDWFGEQDSPKCSEDQAHGSKPTDIQVLEDLSKLTAPGIGHQERSNEKPERKAVPCYELPLRDEIELDPWAKEPEAVPAVTLIRSKPAFPDGTALEPVKSAAAGAADVVVPCKPAVSDGAGHEPVKSAAAGTADVIATGKPKAPELADAIAPLKTEVPDAQEVVAPVKPDALASEAGSKQFRGLELSLKLIFPGAEVLRDVVLNGVSFDFYLPGRQLALDQSVMEEDRKLKEKICQQEGIKYFVIDTEDSKNPRRVERILQSRKTNIRV